MKSNQEEHKGIIEFMTLGFLRELRAPRGEQVFQKIQRMRESKKGRL